MEKRTVLSILTMVSGSAVFGLGVYVFHYFYHPVSTLLLVVMGCLLVDVGIAYFSEQEGMIGSFFRVGLKRTRNIRKKRPRKRRVGESAEG